MPPRTVKRIPSRNRKSGRTDDLEQQIRVPAGTSRTRQGLSQGLSKGLEREPKYERPFDRASPAVFLLSN